MALEFSARRPTDKDLRRSADHRIRTHVECGENSSAIGRLACPSSTRLWLHAQPGALPDRRGRLSHEGPAQPRSFHSRYTAATTSAAWSTAMVQKTIRKVPLT